MAEQRDSIDLALDRILAIEWKVKPSRGNAHKALMLEYFRRVALWSKALGLDHFPTWPFLNIPHLIDPSVQLDESRIEALKPIGRKDRTAQMICEQFLRWTLMEDTPEVKRYALPTPYEPLIRIYERGGLFARDGTGHVSFSSGPAVWIPREKYEFESLCKRTPFLDFDDQTLDRLDQEDVRVGEPWPLVPYRQWKKPRPGLLRRLLKNPPSRRSRS